MSQYSAQLALTIYSFDNVLLCLNSSITPNLDGRNDIYLPIIYNSHLIESYQLWIYDRWGELIFKTNDYVEGWDGKFKGKVCPTGVYTWQVQYDESDANHVERGTLHIMY